mmetsp:Transcript_18428/g.33190  ORF Transcript_18428/g.33190 Transcript_18428/m.33190 type:complete len:631 (-) Transcript_18428:2760-4652(-)
MKGEDLELYSWGVDTCGQLGLPESGQAHPVPRMCDIKLPIRNVACGEDYSLLLTTQGQVFSLGSNTDGRLGLGDKAIRYKTTPTLVKALADLDIVQISCGWGHSAALTAEGRVCTWGNGASGALGTGAIESEWKPVQMKVPGKVVQVDCGARHTGIVLPGELYMCGSGDSGQLGTGRRNRVITPIKITIETSVTAVACGIFHTLVLTKQGRVLAMGGNTFGQLGIGNKQVSLVPVEVKALKNIVQVDCCHFSAAVSDRGTLYVWGTGVFGEFLTPRTVTNIPSAVKRVKVGSCFAAALDAQSKLWTWGSNSSGELGLGDFEPRANPTLVEQLSAARFTDFDCGSAFILAVGCSDSPRALHRDNSALRLSQLGSVPNDLEASRSRQGSQPEILISYRSHGSSSPRTNPEIRSPRAVPEMRSEARSLRQPPAEDVEHLGVLLSKERSRRQELEILAEDLQQELEKWELEFRPLEEENCELKSLVDSQAKRIGEVEALLIEKDTQNTQLLERVRELEHLLKTRDETSNSEKDALLQMQHELRLRARDYKNRTLHRLRASPLSVRTEATSVSSPRLQTRPSSPRVALSPQHMSRIARAAEERTLQSSSSLRTELQGSATDRRQYTHSSRLYAPL